MPTTRQLPRSQTALVLSGGNALGAYGAGAYEALHLAGYGLDLVAGASIGAVNGAIIAGNRSDDRVAKLREFWSQAGMATAATAPTQGRWRELQNAASVLQTLLVGRPGLFAPSVPGLLSTLPGVPSDRAIFDHRLSVATLARVIDFEWLQARHVPLIITAADARTGQTVTFDTRLQRLSPAHLLASSAMPPLFPPVEIDGRLLVDPGLVENLPLNPVLEGPLDQDLLCFAVDAFMPNHEALHDLDTASERALDILFSAQSRRTLEWNIERHRLRRKVASLAKPRAGRGGDRHTNSETELEGTRAEITMVLIAYRAPPHELAAKALDFSMASIAQRWSAGRDDMQRALDLLRAGRNGAGEGGFTLYDCR